MRKLRYVALPAVFFLVAAAGVWATSSRYRATPERTDCPGKIVCPITGAVICVDQCPLEGR